MHDGEATRRSWVTARATRNGMNKRTNKNEPDYRPVEQHLAAARLGDALLSSGRRRCRSNRHLASRLLVRVSGNEHANSMDARKQGGSKQAGAQIVGAGGKGSAAKNYDMVKERVNG